MIDHKMIFIAGLHRSGTSILHECLRDHPLVSGFSGTPAPEDEGQHLQSVFPTAWTLGGPGLFGFNPRAHLTESSDLLTADNKARLIKEWCRYVDLKKPYIIEKSPPNLLKTRFLQAIFPNSYFIVIMRHPIVTSLATKKMTKIWTNLAILVEHWLRCHEIFMEDSSLLRRILIIKYEDFVRQPGHYLGEVCRFLGVHESWGPQEVRSNVNARYMDVWRKLRNSPWTSWYAEFVLKHYARRIEAFGYELS